MVHPCVIDPPSLTHHLEEVTIAIAHTSTTVAITIAATAVARVRYLKGFNTKGRQL